MKYIYVFKAQEIFKILELIEEFSKASWEKSI